MEEIESSQKLHDEGKSPSLLRLIFKFVFKCLLIFIIASVFQVIILRIIPPALTPLMVIRSVERLISGKSPVVNYEWRALSQISSSMQLAVIASEDQNFPNHFGLDFKELKKAYKKNKRGKRKGIRGASTITQQVAKNVFLIPNRWYIRKVLELYYSFLIEALWGKKKILETYLNVVEMGEGIYGTEAAGLTYFKSPAKEITKDEAAAIAAVLPNPRKYSVKNPSSYLLKRRGWIKRQMNSLGKKYLEKL